MILSVSKFKSKSLKKIISTSLFFLILACSSEESLDKAEELKQIKDQIAALELKASELESSLGTDTSQAVSDLKRVIVSQLSYQSFSHFIEAQGNVKADKNILLRPEVTGTLLKKYVAEGDRVRAGAKLFQLDTELLSKNIAELESQLDFATTLFQRQSNLWDKRVTTEIQYLEAKNRKDNLEKKLSSLKSQLKKATISAPIEAIVDEVLLNVGEIASPSTPLARIVNLDKVKITAEVSERYISQIDKKTLVNVILPDGQTEKTLQIQYIGQFINPNNRSFKIFLDIANKDLSLKPNMIVTLKIRDFFEEVGLVVPSYTVLQSTAGERFIYIVAEEEGSYLVKKRFAEVLKTYQDRTLISSGLQAGDLVITKGYNEVVSGQEVVYEFSGAGN